MTILVWQLSKIEFVKQNIRIFRRIIHLQIPPFEADNYARGNIWWDLDDGTSVDNPF